MSKKSKPTKRTIDATAATSTHRGYLIILFITLTAELACLSVILLYFPHVSFTLLV